MGCTYDMFQIKLKKEEYAKQFANLWNKILGEGDYLYEFYEDIDLFEEFVEKDGTFVLNIEEEPLFGYYDVGNQIHLMLMAFIENVPDAEFEAEYNCTFNNCGDVLYNTYNYSSGKLIIRSAYSEYGEGCYCPECDESLGFRMIELEPEELTENRICPHCGSEIEYEADIDLYVLKYIDGKWEYPDGFSFRPKIEESNEKGYIEKHEEIGVPSYILNKENAKKSGIAKIMIDLNTLKTIMHTDPQPEKTKRLNMIIDYIDLPIKVVATVEEAPGKAEFKIYSRQVWEDDSSKEDGVVIWDPASGTFDTATADTSIAEQVKTSVVATYYYLILYLATTSDFNEYDTTDLELEHLLVYTENEVVNSRIVYGTDRPNLLANGLIGGYEYVRPCANEKSLIEERN